MQLFYTRHIENGLALFDEEESRHLLQVLRYQPGDTLRITDGLGHFHDAELVAGGKKQAVARLTATHAQAPWRTGRLHVAIAPTKQIERFEWFLEKATEVGIDTITPLLCKRSERTTIRLDRLEKIVVSAMKQSLRAWLPQLNPLTPFAEVVKKSAEPQRFLAWCDDAPKPDLRALVSNGQDCLVLIGPEGDFTPEEAALALGTGFQAVSLGPARLRTETAGLAAVFAFGS